MIKSYFWNRKWAAWAYGGGAFLIASIYLQVQMTVLLNRWYNQFYTLLQAPQGHDVSEFWSYIFEPRLAPHNFFGLFDLPMPSSFLWIAIPFGLAALAFNRRAL